MQLLHNAPRLAVTAHRECTPERDAYCSLVTPAPPARAATRLEREEPSDGPEKTVGSKPAEWAKRNHEMQSCTNCEAGQPTSAPPELDEREGLGMPSRRGHAHLSRHAASIVLRWFCKRRDGVVSIDVDCSQFLVLSLVVCLSSATLNPNRHVRCQPVVDRHITHQPPLTWLQPPGLHPSTNTLLCVHAPPHTEHQA